MMTFPSQVQIYGDSILKGVQLDQANQKYILPKKNNLERWGKRLSLSVQNYSKFGCTVEKGFQIVRRQLAKWKKAEGSNPVVLLEYGGNDSDYDWTQINADPTGDYHPHTELPVFRRVLRGMVEFVREQGMTPVMMNLPPVDSIKYLNWLCRSGTGIQKENLLQWLRDPEIIYRHQELYSAAVCQVAWETNTPLIDVRSEFLKSRDYKNLICQDGIHPSAAGHRLIQKSLAAFAQQFSRFIPAANQSLQGAV